MDIAQLLAFGVKNGASDLHLSAGLRPMIRVDGDVRRINVDAMPHEEIHSMVYDIMNDKQRKTFEEYWEVDFSFEIPGLARFRVNAFNHNRGAGAVFRTIPSKILTLEELGAPVIFEEIAATPRGIVLVTGPTGSGKSTTLYSTLHHVSNPEINITTVEDPVEMVYEEFNQIAVQNQIDVTFSTILRNILRQDPDIIMIGEIRDYETAAHASQAALTGHLVLSTLHTNNAAGGVTRLLDMGVEDYLMTSTVNGIVAQRLVRRLCEHCREPYTPLPEVAADLFEEWESEIATIENVKLQSKSRASLKDTRSRYNRLQRSMDKAEASMAPVMVNLRDYVLYLKHNLNAQAVSSLKREVADIEAEVSSLIADMNRSIKEADAFVKAM